ncbi:hypothetical protein J23TS9_45670 [Paenibacillus sp. J23TS9]|uniref:hypothetical protein n=1 Tax=Paenibacillus sp. J23TS9 TaxID=2807193 RepID=UPI001B17BE38|nr:hypothetical protein [Paenibacillus sp. J23TS9]GIP29437.1 hypothetical protein J23TS9_45670 [Paenibacillus sp. J23TS9]
MKRMTSISVLLVLMLSLAACGSGEKSDHTPDSATKDSAANEKTSDNSDSPTKDNKKEEPAGSNKNNETDSSVSAADPMDLSQYYVSEQPVEKEIDKSQFVWKQGSVTLKASLSKSEGVQVVSSASIDKGDQHFDLKLDPKPSGISSVALSADESYIAIEGTYHLEIPRTFIVDLKDGTFTSLVDPLKKNNVKQADITTSFAWSPQGNSLAFAYGGDSSLWISIYDLDQKKFTYVPAEKDFTGYISISYILWGKDGQSVSYISEYPSDQMKLYRYRFANSSVTKVKDLTREEFDKFQKFSPYILNH